MIFVGTLSRKNNLLDAKVTIAIKSVITSVIRHNAADPLENILLTVKQTFIVEFTVENISYAVSHELNY